jgi:hypothetical protein
MPTFSIKATLDSFDRYLREIQNPQNLENKMSTYVGFPKASIYSTPDDVYSSIFNVGFFS